MRSTTSHIKLWIWNNFVKKYYDDWIQDEINDSIDEQETYGVNPYYYDLD